MKQSKDPLTAATTSYLWPYLKSIGFTKVTARKFAREKNSIIQQLWVDANGFGGKERTIFILCSNLVFDSVRGYMDPCGFRICNGQAFDMSSHEKACSSMKKVITALEKSELKMLEQVSSIDNILKALEAFWKKEWFETRKELANQWKKGNKELRKIAQDNRTALKL